MSTLLDSALCCLALCLSYAALCFGWAQWKESQAWDEPGVDGGDDEADWWKKQPSKR